MTSLAFSINENTPREKERLDRSVNWVETSLTSYFKFFVRMLFGPVAIRKWGGIIIFLT